MFYSVPSQHSEKAGEFDGLMNSVMNMQFIPEFSWALPRGIFQSAIDRYEFLPGSMFYSNHSAYQAWDASLNCQSIHVLKPPKRNTSEDKTNNKKPKTLIESNFEKQVFVRTYNIKCGVPHLRSECYTTSGTLFFLLWLGPNDDKIETKQHPEKMPLMREKLKKEMKNNTNPLINSSNGKQKNVHVFCYPIYLFRENSCGRGLKFNAILKLNSIPFRFDVLRPNDIYQKMSELFHPSLFIVKYRFGETNKEKILQSMQRAFSTPNIKTPFSPNRHGVWLPAD